MEDIIKKFRFKNHGVVLNAPTAMAQAFMNLGFKTSFDKKAKSMNTLVFIDNSQTFIDFLTNHLQKVVPDSVLWFAYPKGSSKVKTDINRDTIRVTAKEFGITTVTAISIDDTWSALRFRPIERVGK